MSKHDKFTSLRTAFSTNCSRIARSTEQDLFEQLAYQCELAEAYENFVKNEEGFAKAWERGFIKTRAQAIDLVDMMAAKHKQRFAEAAATVCGLEGAAERNAVAYRASTEEAAQRHRVAVSQCEVACLARLNEETLAAALRIQEAQSRSNAPAQSIEVANLHANVRALQSELTNSRDLVANAVSDAECPRANGNVL